MPDLLGARQQPFDSGQPFLLYPLSLASVPGVSPLSLFWANQFDNFMEPSLSHLLGTHCLTCLSWAEGGAVGISSPLPGLCSAVQIPSPASFPCLRTSELCSSQPCSFPAMPEAPASFSAPALYLARPAQMTLFGVSPAPGAAPVSTASFLGTRSPAIVRKKGVKKTCWQWVEPSPFPKVPLASTPAGNQWW